MSRANDSFIVLSINHEKAPLEIRERYSVDDGRIASLYEQLRQHPQVEESLVLNTCNRFELYAQLSPEATPEQLLNTLARFFQDRTEEMSKHLHLRSGQEAIQHMIEVSAGLRSQITGEAEIFGQVKHAYAQSHLRGNTGRVLNRIFQKGFQAAKLIRHATSIGEGQINIANVAVELASKIFGSLASAAVLALGTGEIGEKTVKALRSRGATRFGVASRSAERAAAVAAEWGGEPHSVAELASYLPRYDIIIASVGSDESIITKSLLKQCASKRQDRPLFLIDLGLPRNVDKSCGGMDNVFLYNLDDLAAIAEENLAERRKALAESQRIAEAKSQHIWESILRRGA